MTSERWRCPCSIPALVLQAHAAGGIDSARAVFRSTTAEMAARPGSYAMWPQSLRAAAEQLAQQGHPADAAEVLRWCRERWPREATCAGPLAAQHARR